VDGTLSQFALRLALVVAATASVVVLTGLFTDPVRYACVGVVVVAALLTASERRRPGGGWWVLLATGALLSAIGAGLAELNDTLGGLCAVAGGALVVIAATIGFPAGDDEA
jgi:hypothetical protein